MYAIILYFYLFEREMKMNENTMRHANLMQNIGPTAYRGPKTSKPRRAGRGRGKPLPEGEEGVLEEGRKISLDHLRPKGWWD